MARRGINNLSYGKIKSWYFNLPLDQKNAWLAASYRWKRIQNNRHGPALSVREMKHDMIIRAAKEFTDVDNV